MSNYPPGVTGNEFEIAGPDFEVEDEMFCHYCDCVQPGIRQGYRHEQWFICDVCEEQTDDEGEAL